MKIIKEQKLKESELTKDERGRILVSSQEYNTLLKTHCSHPKRMTSEEYHDWMDRVEEFVNTYAEI